MWGRARTDCDVPDTTAFLSNKFEVQDYAKAVLQGRAYRPDDEDESGKGNGVARATDGQGERGDVSVELAKLNQGIVSPATITTRRVMLLNILIGRRYTPTPTRDHLLISTTSHTPDDIPLALLKFSSHPIILDLPLIVLGPFTSKDPHPTRSTSDPSPQTRRIGPSIRSYTPRIAVRARCKKAGRADAADVRG